MSGEPSNAASEALLASGVFLSEGRLSAEVVRAFLTDDYTYEDRCRGVSFPNADAESYPALVVSTWDLGAGRPTFIVLNVLAVRGERFAAALVCIDYGNGMLRESIQVLALDASLSLLQRQVDFDTEDIDAAIAELDRLHAEANAL